MMKLTKLYSLIFRKTGVNGPTLQMVTEEASYEAKVIEWDHKTERLLQLTVTNDIVGGADVTLKFTSDEARRLGEVFVGFAKAFERFDAGRTAGYAESYANANKAE